MDDAIVLTVAALGQRWQTLDPFLFCVHHDDDYPPGDRAMAPEPALLAGRELGMDFAGKDGFSMYHGTRVPGFPRHPHRGFETVTLARRGFIDHADSMGAAARFGQGDVQWMTAGAGVCHSEMFPLIHADRSNRTELFQIWLNLPAADKLCPAHFTMFWSEKLTQHRFTDTAGASTQVVCVAGTPDDWPSDPSNPSPPPNSWASRPDAEVAIWTIELEAGASWVVPAGPCDVHRVLYFFAGDALEVAGQRFPVSRAIQVRPDAPVRIRNGEGRGELLMLQGRPIGEPVAQHGPFVMTSNQEIGQAIADYQKDGFGGWPWSGDDPVHPRDKGRFARHADGREEQPPVRGLA